MPAVDDEAHTVDGDAGLGDVGGADDLAFPGEVLEDAALLLAREAAEERQDLEGRVHLGAEATDAVVDRGGAGQED